MVLQFPYPNLPVFSIMASLDKYSQKEASALIWKVAASREGLCSVNTGHMIVVPHDKGKRKCPSRDEALWPSQKLNRS